MERSALIKAFEALAHGVRLDILRLLVPEGPEGLPAGGIADRLGLAPSGLSFHLGRLVNAGLVTCRRQGRQLYYATNYETVAGLTGFLSEDCCANAAAGCLPDCAGGAAAERRGPGLNQATLEITGDNSCTCILFRAASC